MMYYSECCIFRRSRVLTTEGLPQVGFHGNQACFNTFILLTHTGYGLSKTKVTLS